MEHVTFILFVVKAAEQKRCEFSLDILQLIKTPIPPLLEPSEEVLLAGSIARKFGHVMMECIRVLDEHGRGVEAFVQLAEEVVLFQADLPERPSVFGLVFKVDVRGVFPRHLDVLEGCG